MSRNWKKCNREIIKREEILINPEIFGSSQKREKNRGSSYVYPDQPITLLHFQKFALGIPYWQKEGLARKTFSNFGIKVSKFRTLLYRLTKGEYSPKELSHMEKLPGDFVIIKICLRVGSVGKFFLNRADIIPKSEHIHSADMNNLFTIAPFKIENRRDEK